MSLEALAKSPTGRHQPMSTAPQSLYRSQPHLGDERRGHHSKGHQVSPPKIDSWQGQMLRRPCSEPRVRKSGENDSRMSPELIPLPGGTCHFLMKATGTKQARLNGSRSCPFRERSNSPHWDCSLHRIGYPGQRRTSPAPPSSPRTRPRSPTIPIHSSFLGQRARNPN